MHFAGNAVVWVTPNLKLPVARQCSCHQGPSEANRRYKAGPTTGFSRSQPLWWRLHRLDLLGYDKQHSNVFNASELPTISGAFAIQVYRQPCYKQNRLDLSRRSERPLLQHLQPAHPETQTRTLIRALMFT